MTSKKMAVGLTCCYFKHLGWPARQIMTNPILTAIIGAYMDTKLSTGASAALSARTHSI